MPPPIPHAFRSRFAKACNRGRRRSFTWTTSASGEDWTVKLETSQFDPLLGETYVQFAWKGLKHQLSQGAGAWTLPEGRRTSYYKLIDSAMPKPPAADAHESDFFDGIDTSLPGLASRLGADETKVPWLRPQLDAIAKTVADASAAAEKNSQAAAKPLLTGLSLTRALISKVESSELSAVEKADLLADLRTKQEQFEQAANLALGLDLGVGPGTPDGRPMAETFSTGEGDVLAAVITAGKSFLLMAKLHNGSSLPSGSEAVHAGCSAGLEVRAVHGPSAQAACPRRRLRAHLSGHASSGCAADQGVLPSQRS